MLTLHKVPMAEAKARLGDIEQKVGLRCGRNGVIFGYPINDGKQYFLSVTAFNYGSWSHDKWSKATDVEAMKAKFADWDDFTRRQVSLFPNNGGTMAWSLWEMRKSSYCLRHSQYSMLRLHYQLLLLPISEVESQ